jgi:hypothetical protein
MVSKLMTSLVALAVMASPVVAQEYPEEEFPLPERQVSVVRGSCDRAAEQAVAMTGGELLSVRPARNGRPICAVTVLVINAKGRPKKVRLRIPMDM